MIACYLYLLHFLLFISFYFLLVFSFSPSYSCTSSSSSHASSRSLFFLSFLSSLPLLPLLRSLLTFSCTFFAIRYFLSFASRSPPFSRSLVQFAALEEPRYKIKWHSLLLSFSLSLYTNIGLISLELCRDTIQLLGDLVRLRQ